MSENKATSKAAPVPAQARINMVLEIGDATWRFDNLNGVLWELRHDANGSYYIRTASGSIIIGVQEDEGRSPWS
jgi:hypothetical protein